MIRFQVRVKTNARQSELMAMPDDSSWVARVKSAPIDGKANEELIGLIARHFNCPKKNVTIRHGAGSRNKLVQVDAD